MILIRTHKTYWRTKRLSDVGIVDQVKENSQAMRLSDCYNLRRCMTQSFTNLLPRSRSLTSISQVVGSVQSSKIDRGRWAANFPNRFLKHLEIQIQRSFASSHEYSSTIYALSTAPGRAAIAIIRISGTASLNVGPNCQTWHSYANQIFWRCI